jgi:heme-degrading monooxygenase HmoA
MIGLNQKKGRHMAIKVIIKRQFKREALQKASQVLMRMRYSAMGMEGYISSETLSVYEDPTQVIVISMWQSLKDWRHWSTSAQRGEYAAELAKHMSGPEQIQILSLGIERSS